MEAAPKFKIGLVGAGNIGKTLAQRLAAAGHSVKVANSRGPETIDADTLKNGARAVTTADALKDVQVAILSIPLGKIPDLAPLIAALPADTVILDTSNYYPFRDGKIAEIEGGMPESVWVSTRALGGRSIVKAWNAIFAKSFADKALPKGSPGRIALPIAAESEREAAIAVQLMNDTGFDALHAGGLADSWRFQPAAPSYCTDLTLEQLPAAVAAAEKDRLPGRRDVAMAVLMERMAPSYDFYSLDHQWVLNLSRAIYMYPGH